MEGFKAELLRNAVDDMVLAGAGYIEGAHAITRQSRGEKIKADEVSLAF